MTVTVVTDSAASLPAEAVGRLGIVVVPMTLVLGGIVYADGDVPVDELVARSATEGVTTASPSPGEYLKALEATGTEDDVLVLTVSSRMSATFEVAKTASRYVGPGAVRVLDTGTAAGGQGLVALAAAACAAEGKGLDDVAAEGERVASRVRLLAALDNLDYLARSGRVPGVAAWAGRSLGVRAMFEFSKGSVKPRRPALSTSAAIERMLDACFDRRERRDVLHVAVLHAQAQHLAEDMVSRIRGSAPDADLFVAPFSSVMVAHTGPGLIGAAWWWDGVPSVR
jgi:DegV family protein with EDD domain